MRLHNGATHVQHAHGGESERDGTTVCGRRAVTAAVWGVETGERHVTCTVTAAWHRTPGPYRRSIMKRWCTLPWNSDTQPYKHSVMKQWRSVMKQWCSVMKRWRTRAYTDCLVPSRAIVMSPIRIPRNCLGWDNNCCSQRLGHCLTQWCVVLCTELLYNALMHFTMHWCVV